MPRLVACELVLGETDHDPAVEHANGGRSGAGGANSRFAGEPDLDAARGGEAVCDERRLERDDSALLGERGLDLVADADQVLHGGAA